MGRTLKTKTNRPNKWSWSGCRTIFCTPIFCFYLCYIPCPYIPHITKLMPRLLIGKYVSKRKNIIIKEWQNKFNAMTFIYKATKYNH